MKKLSLLLLTLLFTITLSACSNPTYTNISNSELKTMLENSDDYQFIDVRTSSEYLEGHIPGFNHNVDYYKLEKDHSLVDDFDKSKPVVIMCRSGNRSVSAANILLDLGFEEVYNLEFGINNWDGDIE